MSDKMSEVQSSSKNDTGAKIISEVEAAKKAVLAKWDDAAAARPAFVGSKCRQVVSHKSYSDTTLFVIGAGSDEDAAWIHAASNLAPLTGCGCWGGIVCEKCKIAPLTEDAAKELYCECGKNIVNVGDQFWRDSDNLVCVDNHWHKPAVPASPAGDAPKEIDWANDEAAVRATWPSVWFSPSGFIWKSESSFIGSQGTGDNSAMLGSSAKEARQHPTVVAFEREQNPAFKVSASPVGELDGAFEAWWNVYALTLGAHEDSQLDARSAWNAALSSKPATVSLENASRDVVTWFEDERPDLIGPKIQRLRSLLKTKKFQEDTVLLDRISSDTDDNSKSLVGRSKSEWHRQIDALFSIARPTEDIPFNALHVWVAKPTPEGIPERPKPDTLRSHKSDIMWPCYHKNSMDKWIEAIISAKDAEIARVGKERDEAWKGANVSYQHTTCCVCLIDKHTPVRCDDLGGYICGGCLEKAYFAECDRAEAAEAELASLKLSSAKVREEALWESAVTVENTEVVECGGTWNRADDGMSTLYAASRAILSLLPTSPESQEGK